MSRIDSMPILLEFAGNKAKFDVWSMTSDGQFTLAYWTSQAMVLIATTDDCFEYLPLETN